MQLFCVYVACQDQHKNGCIRDCGGKGNALRFSTHPDFPFSLYISPWMKMIIGWRANLLNPAHKSNTK